MNDKLTSFKTKLEQLPISENDKNDLLNSLAEINKDVVKLQFINKQVEKDKSMTINLLQTTVNELQQQKDYIAHAHELMTEQKELLEIQSQQLAKNLHALQLSYYELEQFAYIASHDLKSPLRNIAGYSQLLQKRYYGRIDAEADSFLDFIVDSTKTMSNIITHVLEYSGLNNNTSLSLTQVSRILELIKDDKNDIIKANNATIECHNLPTVWVQKNSIIQLFNQLIDNAIKYRSEKPPHIKITAEFDDDDSVWTFSVKDNGIGLDETYQDKAFQLFQRIEKRHLPGAGMGLAICQKVVKMHGGNIWFKQNTEGGTSFFFTIPQIKIENNIVHRLSEVA